ncbi:MAG: polysaccharide biosynthesis C-terminal domain-containing protein [Clostridia bacterium]|nr:polysaccharide biosynthesis C-terminal domain-containing protein [Clostridia bacterium]
MVKRKTVNLTTGNLWKVLLMYSLPLFGSAFVQQMYSLVDLLVVGNFAKEGALAVDAIGNATVVINVLLAFAFGANGGCSVVVARHFGENNFKRVRETVNTAVVSYSVLCAVIMILGFSLGGVLLGALGVHGKYFNDCLDYLYIFVGSLPFVFIYNLGCGVCSALGDSKSPFIFLVISSVLNIALDFAFVCGLHMDVAGAAWATFISQAVSCVLTVIVVVGKLRSIKSEEKPALFDKRLLKELVITSIPIILQQSFVSVGNFFVNRCINGIDETGDAITGFTTAFKVIVMCTMSTVAMTNGFSNFASQNRAAGEYGRIKKGFWIMVLYMQIVCVVFLAVFVSCPQFLTQVFIQAEKLTDTAMSYSVMFLTIVSCFMPVVGMKIMADGAVRGCGGNIGFTVSTFTDLILRVALVYILVAAGWGFAGVCWAWAIGWSVGAAVGFTFWIVMYKKFPKDKPAEEVTAPAENIV